VAASNASAVWVPIRIRRLSKRSASRPPCMLPRSVGMNCTAMMSPTCVGLPVIVNTSHPMATVCIQLPMSETSWPRKNRR
jgi:hypothetical protein